MTLTVNEKRTVLAVFGELNKKRYSELNTFLGSETIREMQTLYQKLRYEEYCERHGITYEEMAEDDFIDAALEEAEAQGYAV